MGVVRILCRRGQLVVEDRTDLRSYVRGGDEVLEPFSDRRPDAGVEGRGNLAAPEGRECWREAVDRLQSRREWSGTDRPRRERIRRELLLPGDAMRNPQEHVARQLERLRWPGMAVTLGKRTQRAPDGAPGLVDPGAEASVAAVKVAELMREDRVELRHREGLQQRESNSHDPLTPESHETPALSDPRIQVGDEVDMHGRRLTGRGGGLVDQAEEPRMGRRLEAGT